MNRIPGEVLRWTRRLLILAAAVLIMAGAVSVVSSAARVEAEVLYACAGESGIMRLVGDPAECRRGEQAVAWNVKGPAGPEGPAGPAGSTEVKVHLQQDTRPAARLGYIKIDGIEGEAQDKDHKGWSEILSFSQAIHSAGGAGGAGAGAQKGAVVLNDIVITKQIDKASPKLAEACLTGKHFPSAEITVVRTLGDGRSAAYFTYELKNVSITSYQTGGSGHADVLPMDQFSLNFEEIKVTYKELDPKGGVKEKVEYTWKVQQAAH